MGRIVEYVVQRTQISEVTVAVDEGASDAEILRAAEDSPDWVDYTPSDIILEPDNQDHR